MKEFDRASADYDQALALDPNLADAYNNRGIVYFAQGDLEAAMAAPGFYEDHVASKPVIDRHQALMWEVGDLMNKWEALQSETEV